MANNLEIEKISKLARNDSPLGSGDDLIVNREVSPGVYKTRRGAFGSIFSSILSFISNPISSDVGNAATLGNDNKIYVPATGSGIFKVAQAAPVTLTGTTAETVLAALLIPAGTIAPGTVIKLAMHMHHRNNTQCIMRVYANTTPNIAGTPQLLNRDQKTGGPGNRMYDLQYVVSTGGTTRGIPILDVVDTNNLTNCKFAGVGFGDEHVAVDWSVNQHIVITGEITGNTQQVTLNAAVLTAM